MNRFITNIKNRYLLLREKGQTHLASIYLALGWTIFGQEFVSKRMLRENSGTGCFVYTNWCLFWLFNEIQPLASESQPAKVRFDKKPRWQKTF